MAFIVTLRHRDGSTKTWTTEGNCGNCWRDSSLGSALLEILWQTMDEDDTGYFFEAATADIDYIRTHKNFQIIPYYGRDMVCDVVKYEWK